MALLKDENIKKIAVANPKTAPYGKAAVEAMKNASVYEDVKINLSLQNLFLKQFPIRLLLQIWAL